MVLDPEHRQEQLRDMAEVENRHRVVNHDCTSVDPHWNRLREVGEWGDSFDGTATCWANDVGSAGVVGLPAERIYMYAQPIEKKREKRKLAHPKGRLCVSYLHYAAQQLFELLA
jgi:hypothetical protein